MPSHKPESNSIPARGHYAKRERNSQMEQKYALYAKKEIVDLYTAGYTVTELCKEHGVSKSSLYNWIHEFSQVKSKTMTIEMNDYILLKKRFDRLKQENEIFMQCECAFTAPLHEKMREIKRLMDRYPIRALCRVLQVPRSTFLHFLYRGKEKTQWEIEDEYLRERTLTIFNNSQQRFGAKKIKVILDEENLHVSPRRIQRLMNEMNLKCNIKKPPRKRPSEQYQHYCKNLLKREFHQDKPNAAWVSDITYFKSYGRKFYLCVILDLFSRKVIAHEVSTSMSGALVTATFLDAYLKRNQPAGLIFHSDQGSQYTSVSFSTKLRGLNVVQSLSKPGCPYDNSVSESFFATLKKEELHRDDSEYKNLLDFRLAIDEFVDYYNNDRPHQSMNYLTPNQVEKKYNETH